MYHSQKNTPNLILLIVSHSDDYLWVIWSVLTILTHEINFVLQVSTAIHGEQFIMVGINQFHQTYIKQGFKKSITVCFADEENII